jgi:hypothetical protein
MPESDGLTGAVATILGHRDPTVVPKSYGKHTAEWTEHLRSLVERRQQTAETPEGRRLIAVDVGPLSFEELRATTQPQAASRNL